MKSIDWELMKNGAANVSKRRILLYGASTVGERFVKNMTTLGLASQIIAVSDSNEKKWGEKWNGYSIIPPTKIEKYSEDILIVITSTFVAEIFQKLEEMGLKRECTGSVCFSLAIHYDLMQNKAHYLQEQNIQAYKRKYEIWKQNVDFSNQVTSRSEYDIAHVLTRCSTAVLVHGIPKTGNTSLRTSFEGYPNVAFTYHRVYHDELSFHHIKELVNEFDTEIRIITGVRPPIERIISQSWQMVRYPFTNQDENISTVVDEKYTGFVDGSEDAYGDYYDMISYADSKEWFFDQVEKPFAVNVFEDTFDKEKGYSIIKKGSVSVFVYRLDKLSQLEEEIREFSGISNFCLKKSNDASDKAYAMAYKEYMRNVQVKKGFFLKLLKSQGMTHFYTEEECQKIYEKWEKHLID